MAKKILVILVSFVLGLAIFVRIINDIGWQAILDALKVFTGWQGLVILTLTLLSVIIGAWKWKEILGADNKTPFHKLLGFYLAGYSVMFFAPIVFWGGEFLRAYALKDRYALPWPKSMASVAIDRILEWTINLIIIFAAGFILMFSAGFPFRRLTAFLAALFVALLAGLVFFYFKCIKKESIVGLLLRRRRSQAVETEKEIFLFFKLKNPRLWRAFFITFLRSLILYIRAFLLIIFLGKKAGITIILSIFGFSYLATMVPIPAALGIHEATQVFVFKSFHLENYTAAAFAMMVRWAEFFVAFLGAAALFFVGMDFLKSAVFKKPEQAIINKNI